MSTTYADLLGWAAAAVLAYGTVQGIRAANKYLSQPEMVQENVIQGPEAELFIERDGQRFYAEIDGKPVLEQLVK